MAAPHHNTINNYITFDFKEKDRFTGRDYERWRMRVVSILRDKEYLGHVDGTTPRPVPADSAAPTADETRAMAAWDKVDQKVLTLLMQCLSTETMHHLYGVSTSKEAWEQLGTAYQAKDTLSQVIATQNFYQLRMLETDTVDKFATNFRIARARLAHQGTAVQDDQAAVLLLAALPQSWGPFVTAQQSRTGLTVASVIAAMIQHEATRNLGNKSSPQNDGALFMRKGNRPRKLFPKDNRGSHDPGLGGSSSGSSWIPANKRSQKCSYCKRPGHWWKECRKKRMDEFKRGVPASRQATVRPNIGSPSAGTSKTHSSIRVEQAHLPSMEQHTLHYPDCSIAGSTHDLRRI